MTAKKKPIPYKALIRIYEMAEMMSHENSYQEPDDTGTYSLGVKPEVQRDLDAVRAWLGLLPYRKGKR